MYAWSCIDSFKLVASMWLDKLLSICCVPGTNMLTIDYELARPVEWHYTRSYVGRVLTLEIAI
jgi:hypothetical protein